jgi:UDP-glucuronate 4-epimerase
MAAHFFLEALQRGTPIHLNHGGRMGRDWVYVEDIASVILHAVVAPLEPHEIWNVGSGTCTPLDGFVDALEALTGLTAERVPAPLPAGDVTYTQADLSHLAARGAPVPTTQLEQGLAAFVTWHQAYYGNPKP